MVCFSGVQAMTKKNFLWFCLLLTACSSPTYRFKITGVEGEFCVPKTGFVAPGVWFVPEDAPGAPEGFSFGGCHRLKQEADRAACSLPEDFIDVDVDSLQERRNRIWSELKESSDYDLLVNTPGTEYAIDNETGWLVISNPNPQSTWQRKGWAIWKRGLGQSAGEALAMRDDDELIAICSNIDDFPRSAGLGSKGEYGCDRYVRGDRYALSYRFISKQRVPSEQQLKALEAALFDQVDRWQCPK
jgi:hypothetical protein